MCVRERERERERESGKSTFGVKKLDVVQDLPLSTSRQALQNRPGCASQTGGLDAHVPDTQVETPQSKTAALREGMELVVAPLQA